MKDLEEWRGCCYRSVVSECKSGGFGFVIGLLSEDWSIYRG